MYTDIKKLVGETLKYVDDCGDEILLTTESGKSIRFIIVKIVVNLLVF